VSRTRCRMGSMRRVTACKATARPRRATPSLPRCAFAYINRKWPLRGRTASGYSVDTKRKNCRRFPQQWAASIARKAILKSSGCHDFVIRELGRAVPSGVYDLAANAGWVIVGVPNHDNRTAAFAVNSLRQWWRNLGRRGTPKRPDF